MICLADTITRGPDVKSRLIKWPKNHQIVFKYRLHLFKTSERKSGTIKHFLRARFELVIAATARTVKATCNN